MPKGLGALHKQHGARQWSSALWLAPDIVSDMIVLLLSDRDIYVACHIKNDDRNQWLIGFDVQTSNPLD